MSHPKNQRKLWYIIGAVAIVAFLAFGASAFKANLTPYVSFDEAKRTHGRVQVAGKLVENSTSFVEASRELSFGLVDEHGEALTVRYKGVKPGNFEEAIQIVAIGSYENEIFYAEQLLVKCPSKYQGEEAQTKVYGSET